MIDAIDCKIVKILQSDARITNAEIARRIELAPSAVLERIRKLEERGVIRRYAAKLDPKALGIDLTAFISVRTSECGAGVGSELAAIPEILEVHEVAGEDCFFIKVCAKNTDDLGALLREKIKAIPNVLNTKTTVVLKTFKESGDLPITDLNRAETKAARK
ncbi:MAG: Lrp/AsnC family transcriptional regulator [Acidobacteriota bacterium]